jgi:hypothetical protein
MIFTYHNPYNKSISCCNLEITGDLALAQDRSDNKGMSVTNAIEFVASQICQKFHIDPYRLIMVTLDEDGYNEVTFIIEEFAQNNSIFGRFTKPEWKLITAEQYQTLLTNEKNKAR